MREPDFETDGWCLEDGEALHAAFPASFEIPPLEVRQSLVPGDFAKLIFRIAIDSEEEPEAAERMWVIVRERAAGGLYLGELDNDPSAIAENDELWSGAELPFAPRHVIDVRPANEASRAAAMAVPRRRWAGA